MIFQNLKSLTFGLATVLFVAISFTACTSNEDNLQAPIEKFTLQDGLVLSADVMALGQSAVQEHLDQADEVTLARYSNNYIVGQYLAKYGKMAEAMVDLQANMNIVELNLADYLNSDQMVQVQAQMITERPQSIERECVPVCYWDGTKWVFAGYYMC